MSVFSLPHKFNPRWYQKEIWNAFWKEQYRRFVLIWHRRAGKDKLCFNLLISAALNRVGVYYYLFPTYAQGDKAIWRGRDAQGFRVFDHIPQPLRGDKIDNQDMLVELRNGSIIQIVGTHNYDRIRGTNPAGVVFSEYSYQDPAAWSVVSPILAENKGFAIFNFTPHGENHAYDLYDEAIRDPKWYTSLKTVDDTGAIEAEELEAERKRQSVEMFNQEYYCSFRAVNIKGAFWAQNIEEAEQEGRISDAYTWDPRYPVYTWWDIGINDATSILFVQLIGREVRIIDAYTKEGNSIVKNIQYVLSKPYVYGKHFLPHDIQHREQSTGESRLNIARKNNLRPIKVVEKHHVADRIEMARVLWSKVTVNRSNCKYELKCWRNYQQDVDSSTGEFKEKPPDRHWANHASDAFGYIAIELEERLTSVDPISEYSPEELKELMEYTYYQNNPRERKKLERKYRQMYRA